MARGDRLRCGFWSMSVVEIDWVIEEGETKRNGRSLDSFMSRFIVWWIGERWLCGGKVRGKGVHCIDEKIHGSFNVFAAALRWWRLRLRSHCSSLGLDGTVAASMGGGVMVVGAKVVILSDFLSWIFKSWVGLLITDLAFFYWCGLLLFAHFKILWVHQL